MNRTAIGTLIGLGFGLILGLGAWGLGWVHVGTAPMTHDVSEMSPGMEQLGSEGMASEDMASGAGAREQEGHDMAAMPGATAPAATPTGDEMPAGAVMITPERQQLIGVRTAPVTRQSAGRLIRTVGTVQYDERLVAHIHTKISGWIETLEVDFTGKLVEKGKPLLTIYSPELVSTQEEYLLARRSVANLGSSQFADVARTSRSLLEATRRRLQLWDISDDQIRQLEERQSPQTSLTLHSPIQGYVIHKNAYEGQYVGPETELFAIADLSRVWVTVDVYESELALVSVGQPATVTLSYEPNRTYRGVVDYIYPYLTGETRTATVRVVLENPRSVLKPDMFANVELRAKLGESLTVPEDAVIDTGVRQVVFVALPGGHFAPREVQVGSRFDGQIQILAGLQEGEMVVSGAAFLVDSESKLRNAMGNMAGHQH